MVETQIWVSQKIGPSILLGYFWLMRFFAAPRLLQNVTRQDGLTTWELEFGARTYCISNVSFIIKRQIYLTDVVIKNKTFGAPDKSISRPRMSSSPSSDLWYCSPLSQSASLIYLATELNQSQQWRLFSHLGVCYIPYVFSSGTRKILINLKIL